MFYPNNQSLPLSISETARLFGLSEKTIRRAVKARELPIMIIKGRYRIQFKDVLEWSSQRPRLATARDTKGIGQFTTGWRTAVEPETTEPNPASKSKGQLTLID